MNPNLPASGFALAAGVWLLRTARLPDEAWARLTFNWPVPWPRMSPAGRRACRAGAGLLGAGGLILAALAWRRA